MLILAKPKIDKWYQ